MTDKIITVITITNRQVIKITSVIPFNIDPSTDVPNTNASTAKTPRMSGDRYRRALSVSRVI